MRPPPRRPGSGTVGVAVVLAFVVLLGVGATDARRRDDGAAGEPPTPVEVRDPSQPASDDSDAAADLVTAYARSRTATYRISGSFGRVSAQGQSFTSPIEIVQRAPARLVRQLGSVAGRRGDRVLRCPGGVDGAANACRLGPPGPTFAEHTAQEVDRFTALVTGVDPLYRVERRGPDCWRMTRTRFDPRGGYGVTTDLCFDLVVGSPRRIETDHGEVVEITEFTDRDPQVTDADLEP